MFTSPVPDQTQAATKLVDGGAGVLHVVKNYTGDVMNFEMAAELAAAETGARVVSVVTDDDVAVQDSTWTAGRRGVGVTVLLEKIAGAAAEQGRDLDQVAEVARTVNANGRSMGVALTSCTVPAAGKPTFELGENEMEMGVGIHGEPGRERLPLAPASEIAEMLVEPILADLPFTKGDPVIAFVNGLGGTPLIELYLLYNEVNKILSGHGVTPAGHRVEAHLPALGQLEAVDTALRVVAQVDLAQPVLLAVDGREAAWGDLAAAGSGDALHPRVRRLDESEQRIDLEAEPRVHVVRGRVQPERGAAEVHAHGLDGVARVERGIGRGDARQAGIAARQPATRNDRLVRIGTSGGVVIHHSRSHAVRLASAGRPRA